LIADAARVTINAPDCLTHRFNFMKDRVMMNSARRGFTLVELILVIVVIAVVTVLVLTASPRARENRRQVSCQKNLKQIGLAFQMYAKDWNGLYPPKRRVLANGGPRYEKFQLVPDGQSIYPQYLNDLSLLLCPSDSGASEVYEEWEEWLASGGDPNAISDFTGKSSYIYTGYVAYTGDYGDFTAEADSQFVGFFRAVSELGWEDFDSDITFSEEQLEKFKEYTAGHSGTIYRLREGMGKLLVTDTSDAATVATVEGGVAVMWDALAGSLSPSTGVLMFNHLGGCNVLFLDGHVEYIMYPGRFPVTPTVASTLGQTPSFR
jgi:prepilin-type N-terminal cleavage/methylation domain-containing protein/prepilin-type processing-associated H-X9-DG protein